MKNVKYLNKVAIFDNCSYVFCGNYDDDNIHRYTRKAMIICNNLNDIINRIDPRLYNNPLKIFIHNPNPESCSFKDLKGLPIKKAKYELSKRASLRTIYLDIVDKSILMENFSILDSNDEYRSFAFDYKLLYSVNKPKDFPVNMLYDSYILYDGFTSKYLWNYDRGKYKNPMIVTDKDIENINREFYDGGDLIYGYHGYHLQSNHPMNYIAIYDYSIIMPYSYISKYETCRPPKIYANKICKRYKVELSEDNNPSLLYADIESKEAASKLFCNYLNIDPEELPEIKMVPDGEWI